MENLFDLIVNNNDSPINFEADISKYYKNDDGEITVFLSVDNGLTRSHVASGSGKNFNTAISNAVNLYKDNISNNSKPKSVKLDIVTELRPIIKKQSRINITNTEVRYNRREDGLMFNKDLSLAFLPEEVESYKMIEDRRIQSENIFNAFEKHFLLDEQKLVKNFLSSKFMNIYRFRTDSWFIDENEFLPLYKGKRFYEELNTENLWQSIELTKDNYFRQVVNPQGKFVYIYNPEYSDVPNKYNILRHAGTTYSMLETYEMMPDKGLMTAIKRAIKYLLTKVEDTTINGKSAQVVVEKDSAKLGGNGLSVVALAKYTELTGDKQYLPLMQNMATWMGELQDETGKFAIHKQIFSTGEDSGFVSHYYPGEAILALCRLYQLDKDEKWLDLAENEATYLITERDVEANLDTIAHDHWLLYALNDLYRERPKDIYLKHSFFIAEAIMKAQRLDTNKFKPEWIGSFDSHSYPASTPAACRSEGLGAAYRLANDHGHHEEAATYKKAMETAIKFQLYLQLKPESVMYYRNKRFCLGAIHPSLNKYELRNDYTQHNISSFISYYNMIK